MGEKINNEIDTGKYKFRILLIVRQAPKMLGAKYVFLKSASPFLRFNRFI
jgi:hypothetical protein